MIDDEERGEVWTMDAWVVDKDWSDGWQKSR